MKVTSFCFLSIFLILGCSNSEQPGKGVGSLKSKDNIILQKLKNPMVTGDFDGDDKIDTLQYHMVSNSLLSEIDYVPNPFKNDWDSIVGWFSKKDIYSYFSFSKTGNDTLSLGAAPNLYCLINLGDLNNDGKDEIAFVIDYFDYSNLNVCNIYTICNKKWTVLKSINIHEDAFETTNEDKVFHSIKGYLEYQHGKWYYLDNFENDQRNSKDFGKLFELKLNRCK